MKHKFAALAGIGLADALREALPGLAGTPVLFRHDAHAFLAGERWLGAAQGAARALGVTLGTGIGVSCCVDGAFVNNALGGPASEVSVWNRPYKGGVVEDAVSVRGLVARYRRMRPDYPAANGVKGIAEAAEAGDAGARAVFAGLGADLAEVLLPLCGRFAPERIVFGGQIAGSFALFENELKAGLARAAPPPGAAAGALGTRAALFGVAREGMGLSHG
jgi:glucokinase